MPAGLAVAAVADVVGTGREISPMGSWFCIMGGGFFVLGRLTGADKGLW